MGVQRGESPERQAATCLDPDHDASERPNAAPRLRAGERRAQHLARNDHQPLARLDPRLESLIQLIGEIVLELVNQHHRAGRQLSECGGDLARANADALRPDGRGCSADCGAAAPRSGVLRVIFAQYVWVATQAMSTQSAHAATAPPARVASPSHAGPLHPWPGRSSSTDARPFRAKRSRRHRRSAATRLPGSAMYATRDGSSAHRCTQCFPSVKDAQRSRRRNGVRRGTAPHGTGATAPRAYVAPRPARAPQRRCLPGATPAGCRGRSRVACGCGAVQARAPVGARGRNHRITQITVHGRRTPRYPPPTTERSSDRARKSKKPRDPRGAV